MREVCECPASSGCSYHLDLWFNDSLNSLTLTSQSWSKKFDWIQLSPQRTFQFLIGAAPTGRQAFSSWGPRANQKRFTFKFPCFMAFRSPYLQIIGASTGKGLKQLSSRFTCSTIFRSKSPSCILDHNPMTKSRENLTLAKPPPKKSRGMGLFGLHLWRFTTCESVVFENSM